MSVHERADGPPPDWEWRLILGVALLAGVRILLSAATLPPFAVTDEPAHYDLIRKYARGQIPGPETDHYDSDTAYEIVLHASPEYLNPRENYPKAGPRPLWQAPPHIRDLEAPSRAAPLAESHNHESFSPPVYYLFAAAWCHVGMLLERQGGSLIYWLRFINAPIHMALVGGAFLFIRRFHPQERVLRLAVPLLIAVFPQDVFFSINSDILSAPLFLLATYLLLEWSEHESPSLRLSIAAGLAAAAVFLVKYSNVAILLLAAIVLAQKLRRTAKAGVSAKGLAAACLATSAASPILAWLIRNQVVLGDLSGTAAKVAHLGWTRKPLAELINHPLFTLPGFWHFWKQLLIRFWCGEAVWFQKTPTPTIIEWFFVAATTILLPAAALAWLTSKRGEAEPKSACNGPYLAIVVASIAFLALLSLPFDYNNSWNPSRASPYFTSGRLILGMLVPFLILIARGARWLGTWGPRHTTAIVLASIVVASLIAPLNLLLLAGTSHFNWFHLP